MLVVVFILGIFGIELLDIVDGLQIVLGQIGFLCQVRTEDQQGFLVIFLPGSQIVAMQFCESSKFIQMILEGQ